MPTADVSPLELDLERLYENYCERELPCLDCKLEIRKQVLLHRIESANDQSVMVSACTLARSMCKACRQLNRM